MAVLARRIVNVAGQPFLIEDTDVHIGVSIGIAIAPLHGHTLDTLMRSADKALYQAKHGGRSRFRFHAPAQPAITSLNS